ncbi:hypothetical protein GCM10010294_28160 [Streptomyces griseoloalbus]|uniref:hypothetical protein n=1 Tax=Streptomyces griseoloalbus TaxID=67303 RepID=UPI0019BEDB60|nr:hypothetical protein GCM10010294_28160 [Streptomyces griseoloalbus]
MTTRTMGTTYGTGRPPSEGRAGRLSPGRTRFTGVLLILLSLISAAACHWVFGWWLPSDSERYQDYRAAEPCSSRAMEQGRTDCLSTWHLTVEETVNRTAGKGSSYKATLTDQDSWRGTVSFGDPGPLLERLESGDRVEATAWRRDIVVLSKDGVRQNTSEAPRDELQMNAAIGVLAGLVAAQVFVFGTVRLVRPCDHEPFTWNPYGKRLLLTTTAICFGVGLPAVWIGIPWWTVPAVAVPVVVGAAVWMGLRLSRSAEGGA